MEFFDTLRQVKTNWNPYKKWELEQQKKEKQNEELRKKYPPTVEELKHAKQYGRTIVDVINTMDQYSIDKSEDAGVVAGNVLFSLTALSLGLGFGAGKILKCSKLGKKIPELNPYYELMGIIIAEAITMTIGNIWQSKIMKQASRVARFQTRENDLKDSRNFVVYNEEQIKEAEKIAKSLPQIKEKRQDKFSKNTFNPISTYRNAKKTTNSLKKDDVKYQEWKKNYIKEEAQKLENFKTLNPSKIELSKAEKDRDAMLNTIKKIETFSLNYLNNMEMATYVIAAVVSTTGLVIGGSISKLVSLMQNKVFTLKPKMLAAINIGLLFVMPIAASIVALAPTNKLIKDAARIGRFKAKQELTNNPQSFITYDEAQRKTITVKEEAEKKSKGLWARFKEDISALKQLQKDAAEYKKYMNTKHKEELKLHEALNQVKISDEQKFGAVQLQKKAFHSFEKMDEKAQRFTDDTDAAVDNIKLIIASIIGITTKLTPVFVCGKGIKKINDGKIPESFGKVLKLTFSGKLKWTTSAVMLMPFILPRFMMAPIVIKGVQIKKDAGKIGVMTAMQDLNNPKNFLDEKNK